MGQYIHKINGIIGKASLSVVLPKNILSTLKIGKGDFVEIDREQEKIVIRKIKGLRDESFKVNDQSNEGSKSNTNCCKDLDDNFQYAIGKRNENMMPADKTFDGQSAGISC